MPDYLAPGVRIEEVPPGPPPIEGLSTSVAAFVGATTRGPEDEKLPVLSGVRDFENLYGEPEPEAEPRRAHLARAVRAFFDNGGRRLYVARVEYGGSYEAALARLEGVEEVSILAAPGAGRDESLDVARLLVQHCERMRYRIAILDSPEGASPPEVVTHRDQLDSGHAAYYYPWVEVEDPLSGGRATTPPSGFVAGVYARNDIERGVQKAPANLEVRGALGLERTVDDAEQELLNPRGVNCLRSFPGRGLLVWGARTLSADPEWKYVNLRRYLAYLEHSIDRGTRWAVFEPNGERLWAGLRRSVEDFLYREFRNGALLGTTAEEAFFVRCDRTTMTQNDIDNGRLVCLVGIAPSRPAEFVIFRIGHQTGDATGPGAG